MNGKIYAAIDLKSFYASVECVERNLDPLKTNLVVADKSRTDKTICLAVSPALKQFGVPGRPRLFEVVQKVGEINRQRKLAAPKQELTGESYDADELAENKSLGIDYIVAPPRMAYYMRYSTDIYKIYLKYAAPEDIHVYSVDEVFIDLTSYLAANHMTARQMTEMIVRDVFSQTGITATAGIGTNLYLCKVAMDIVAKHIPCGENGVRIAELDEMSYRKLLWEHKPITDFWRVGPGTAKRLEKYYIYTMGDVARYSLDNEDFLYGLFGVNAELLIDHAWGYEPCTIADIKAYRPSVKSLSSGQVLKCPTSYDDVCIIIREMADMLSLDLAEKGLAADQVGLTVGYDIQNLKDIGITESYKGEIKQDRYGRRVPKGINGTINLSRCTSSSQLITSAALELFERLTEDHELLIRRLSIAANHVISEADIPEEQAEQLDLFTDPAAEEEKKHRENEALEREKKRQLAVISIKNRYGKNAVILGTSLREGATAMERNRQIGGHNA